MLTNSSVMSVILHLIFPLMAFVPLSGEIKHAGH